MQSTAVISVKFYESNAKNYSTINNTSFWTKIGAAFAHKDGEGFDLVLEAVPLDGRVSLRVPKERESGKK